jgi:hypothetical protein
MRFADNPAFFGRGGAASDFAKIVVLALRLQTSRGRDPKFRAAQKHLANDQFAPEKGEIIALDPKVLSSQERTISQGILNHDVLQMQTVPRSEADAKDRNRVTEILADNFP